MTFSTGGSDVLADSIFFAEVDNSSSSSSINAKGSANGSSEGMGKWTEMVGNRNK
jgi:hypothetical protein